MQPMDSYLCELDGLESFNADCDDVILRRRDAIMTWRVEFGGLNRQIETRFMCGREKIFLSTVTPANSDVFDRRIVKQFSLYSSPDCSNVLFTYTHLLPTYAWPITFSIFVFDLSKIADHTLLTCVISVSPGRRTFGLFR